VYDEPTVAAVTVTIFVAVPLHLCSLLSPPLIQTVTRDLVHNFFNDSTSSADVI